VEGKGAAAIDVKSLFDRYTLFPSCTLARPSRHGKQSKAPKDGGGGGPQWDEREGPLQPFAQPREVLEILLNGKEEKEDKRRGATRMKVYFSFVFQETTQFLLPASAWSTSSLVVDVVRLNSG